MGIALQTDLNAEAACTLPLSTETVVITEPIYVDQFIPFDGGFKTYKRDVAFESGTTMTKENAVFVVQAGGALERFNPTAVPAIVFSVVLAAAFEPQR